MKRTYKYALSVVLSLGLVGSAVAQDSFPDVQDSHWAADAIKRLKGLTFLQGLPNGNFEGKRAITRYEMASLVYAIYAKLVCFDEEVDVKIKKLEEKINGMKVEKPSTPDYSDIRSTLSALKNDVGTIKSWGSDITMLKKMSESYRKELSSLGMDVDDMKKQLNSLSARVKALEAKTDAIRMTGDANFFTAAGLKERGFATGLNQDGRYAGGSNTGAGLDTLTVLHELGLQFRNGASSSTEWGAELVLGNAISNGLNGFGDQASNVPLLGTPYNGGNTAAYLNRAWAKLDAYNAVVGRQGLKLGNFIGQRFDNTSFFENERYDNGEHTFDGASINLGPVKAFIGTMGNMRTTASGVGNVGGNQGGNQGGGGNQSAKTLVGSENSIVQPINLNGLNILRVMGLTTGFKLGEKGSSNLSYVNYDGDTGAFNRFEVFGADLNYDFGSFKLMGGLGKSNAKQNQNVVNDTNNARWNAAANFKTETLDLTVGVQRVERFYFAPGDWGRVGIFRNLTDVTTTTADANLTLTDRLGVFGNYAKGKSISATGEFDTYRAGVNLKLTPKWNVMGSFEDTRFMGGIYGFGAGSGAKFTTVGLDYNFGSNRLFKIWYQRSDVRGLVTPPGLGANQKGGFIAAQYSVKF